MIKIQTGYIALSSVLVISAVTLAVVTSMTLTSISSAQTTLDDNLEESLLMSVESCAEDALLQIYKNDSINSPIVIPTASCTVIINSHVGSDWVFTISTSASSFAKTIEVSATKSGSVTVTGWREI